MATYNPREVLCSFGPVIMGDWAPGSFIEVSQKKPDFKTVAGEDGAIDYVKTIGNYFTVVARIMQTSPVNGLLSSYRITDLTGNLGPLPFLIKDNGPGGATLLFLPSARIIQPATPNFGDSTQARAWTFEGAGEMLVTGNTQIL